MTMTLPSVLARIVTPHMELEDDDYHEWITQNHRVKADRLGRPNERIMSKEWTVWICNNPSCYGQAWVSDAGVRSLIEEAE